MDFRKVLPMFGALALFGCADGNGPGSSDPVDVTVAVSVDLSSFSAVAQIVVEVSAADLPQDLVFNLTVSDGAASGTLVIPAGSARTVTVVAFDGSGIETHRGSVTLDVEAGTNPTLVISLTPQLGEVPIEVYVGSLSIEVTPTAEHLTVGETVQLTAVVTDNQGGPLAVRVAWATLNPGIAVVDTAGLVTGVGAGVTSIVATYGGVAAAARIEVGTETLGGSWTPLAPMLETRRNFATAVIGDTIYVFGGFGKAEVEAYSIATNTWSARTSMPTARGESGAAVFDGKVYVFGGSPASNMSLAVVEVFDPTANSWTSTTPIPTARRGVAVAMVNDLIYVIGGMGGPGAGTTVEVFDPVTATWTTRIGPGQGVAHATATVVDGIIYVTGGDGSGPRGGGPVLQAYDPVADSWSVKSPMLYNHDFHAAAAFDGAVFVAGGGPSRIETEFYDPGTDTWTVGPSMPNARVHNGVVAHGGALYIMGGYTDATGVLGSMDRLDP